MVYNSKLLFRFFYKTNLRIYKNVVSSFLIDMSTFRHFWGPIFSTFRHQNLLRHLDLLDIDVNVFKNTIYYEENRHVRWQKKRAIKLDIEFILIEIFFSNSKQNMRLFSFAFIQLFIYVVWHHIGLVIVEIREARVGVKIRTTDWVLHKTNIALLWFLYPLLLLSLSFIYFFAVASRFQLLFFL